MNACACIGAVGKDPYCPCKMNRKCLKVSITESYISPELFDLLSNEDKTTINDLKFKAVTMAICKQNLLPKEKENEIDKSLGLKAISIRLDIDLIDSFKRIAKQKNLNYQYLMRETLKRYIEEFDKQNVSHD